MCSGLSCTGSKGYGHKNGKPVWDGKSFRLTDEWVRSGKPARQEGTAHGDLYTRLEIVFTVYFTGTFLAGAQHVGGSGSRLQESGEQKWRGPRQVRCSRWLRGYVESNKEGLAAKTRGAVPMREATGTGRGGLVPGAEGRHSVGKKGVSACPGAQGLTVSAKETTPPPAETSEFSQRTSEWAAPPSRLQVVVTRVGATTDSVV